MTGGMLGAAHDPSHRPQGLDLSAVLAAFCLAVPLLNLAVPEGSGLHLPTYLVSLFGKYLAYALLAVSLDSSGAIAASSRSAMERSSRSAAMRWACT